MIIEKFGMFLVYKMKSRVIKTFSEQLFFINSLDIISNKIKNICGKLL
jgi:hypothetical protein